MDMILRRNKRLRRKCTPKVAFDNKKPILSNNPKKRKVKFNKKTRKYTIDNINLKETALDNKLLRVHLIKADLKSLKRKFTNSKKNSELKIGKVNKKNTPTPQITSYNKVQTKTNFKEKFFLKTHKIKSNKMVVSNGEERKVKNSRMFYLKFTNYKTVSEGKLNYKFHQLINDVKNMHLPTPTWKIKVIIRHNKIAAIIFTNKSEIERSVSFNSDEDKYHIIIDNKPAFLIGSPGKVNNSHDIEILLSLLETIEKDNPMIVYK